MRSRSRFAALALAFSLLSTSAARAAPGEPQDLLTTTFFVLSCGIATGALATAANNWYEASAGRPRSEWINTGLLFGGAALASGALLLVVSYKEKAMGHDEHRQLWLTVGITLLASGALAAGGAAWASARQRTMAPGFGAPATLIGLPALRF